MSDAGTAPYTANVDNPLCCDFARTGDRPISLRPLYPLRILQKEIRHRSMQAHMPCGRQFHACHVSCQAKAIPSICLALSWELLIGTVCRECFTDVIWPCRLSFQRQPARCGLCEWGFATKDQNGTWGATPLAHSECCLEGEPQSKRVYGYRSPSLRIILRIMRIADLQPVPKLACALGTPHTIGRSN